MPSFILTDYYFDNITLLINIRLVLTKFYHAFVIMVFFFNSNNFNAKMHYYPILSICH